MEIRREGPFWIEIILKLEKDLKNISNTQHFTEGWGGSLENPWKTSKSSFHLQLKITFLRKKKSDFYKGKVIPFNALICIYSQTFEVKNSHSPQKQKQKNTMALKFLS